jgi:uncharacterized protein
MVFVNRQIGEQAMSDEFDDASFLDNLIPLKVRIDQQQTAGWTPGAPVHQELGCRIHADQMIPSPKVFR